MVFHSVFLSIDLSFFALAREEGHESKSHCAFSGDFSAIFSCEKRGMYPRGMVGCVKGRGMVGCVKKRGMVGCILGAW